MDLNLSSRLYITKPARLSLHPPAVDLSSPVLLVTLLVPDHLVDCDTLAHIFSQFGGNVLKIVVFKKSGQTQALVEFASEHEAVVTKQALDGKSVFPNTCGIKVQFSDKTSLQLKDGPTSRDYVKLGGRPPIALPPHLSESSSSTSKGPAPPPALPLAQNVYLYTTPPATPVLLASNLNEERASCASLFTLFGVYGDVLRVKILFKDRTKALLQLRDPHQAATAAHFLDGLPLWGHKLRVVPSPLFEVQLPAVGAEAAELTHDFAAHPLHRFKVPGSKNFRNLAPPSPALHLSNLPDDAAPDDIIAAFSAHGAVSHFEYFTNTRTMGVLVMKDLDSAITALLELHGGMLPGTPDGSRGISVSFSARGGGAST